MMKQSETLSKALRREQAASEAYRLVLKQSAGYSRLRELRMIQSDHFDTIMKLRECIARHDLSPSEDAGVWGKIALATTATASLFGRRTALSALRKGEELGLHQYEEMASSPQLDNDIKELVAKELVPRQRSHIKRINRMIRHLAY